VAGRQYNSIKLKASAAIINSCCWQSRSNKAQL